MSSHVMSEFDWIAFLLRCDQVPSNKDECFCLHVRQVSNGQNTSLFIISRYSKEPINSWPYIANKRIRSKVLV